MSYFSKGLFSSFIIHALLIIAVLAISSNLPAKKIIQIDFSIEKSSGLADKPPAPAPELKKQEMTRPMQKKEKVHPLVKDEEKLIQTSAVTSTESEDQAPVNTPAVQQETNNIPSSVKNIETSISANAPKGDSPESLKQIYLKEHFTYIRDLIQKKLTYPKIAIHRGWTGKVIISFVICTDGNVKDIKITEGSSYEILDRNTIEIVKKTSPFPRPPVEAQLMIPVTYSLN